MEEKDKHIRVNISMPETLFKRLVKYSEKRTYRDQELSKRLLRNCYPKKNVKSKVG